MAESAEERTASQVVQKKKAVQVMRPIEFVFPDGLEGKYATHFAIQSSDADFILSFFELYPPLASTAEERKILRENPNVTVDAKCVARIHVSVQTMREIMDVLQSYWNQYQEEH